MNKLSKDRAFYKGSGSSTSQVGVSFNRMRAWPFFKIENISIMVVNKQQISVYCSHSMPVQNGINRWQLSILSSYLSLRASLQAGSGVWRLKSTLRSPGCVPWRKEVSCSSFQRGMCELADLITPELPIISIWVCNWAELRNVCNIFLTKIHDSVL